MVSFNVTGNTGNSNIVLVNIDIDDAFFDAFCCGKKQGKIPFTVDLDCEPSGWEPKKVGKIKTCVIRYNTLIKSAAAKLSLAVGKCFRKNS